MIVKICGITQRRDAIAAVEAGADWIGLNFWSNSARYVERKHAVRVADAARSTGQVTIVGVFVNQSAAEISGIAEQVGLDLIQFHGDEPPDVCARFRGRYVKAIRLASADDIALAARYDCDVLLADTPSAGFGGSGKPGDWALAKQLAGTGRNVMLAGGLTPDNVAAAVKAVNPYGVDVAGGVESSPGVKSPELMERFVAAARGGGAATAASK